MKKWTNEEIQLAIFSHNNSLTFSEIANRLNRTYQSVRIKLSNLGYYENNNRYEEIKCKNCGKTFISRKKEKRRYCSQSCAATINNRDFPKKVKTTSIKLEYKKDIKTIIENNCPNCGKTTRKKYCSNQCQREHQKQIIFQKIESGDTTLNHRQYRKYLIHKYGNKCMKCGWSKVNPKSGRVPIQLEHKDGNPENNDLSNLELLCPNCHSLTPTYMGLNRGNGRYKRRERYKNGQSS